MNELILPGANNDDDASGVEDENDDEYDDDSDELSSDMFPFLAEEKCIIDECISLVRQLLRQPGINPAQIRSLGTLLFALERMPLSTLWVDITLTLTSRFNGESSYCELCLYRDPRLILNSGGNSFSPDYGSDSYSSTVFEITPSGGSESMGWGALSGFFESFKDLAADPPEILINDMSDYGKAVWDNWEDAWERIAGANYADSSLYATESDVSETESITESPPLGSFMVSKGDDGRVFVGSRDATSGLATPMVRSPEGVWAPGIPSAYEFMDNFAPVRDETEAALFIQEARAAASSSLPPKEKAQESLSQLPFSTPLPPGQVMSLVMPEGPFEPMRVTKSNSSDQTLDPKVKEFGDKMLTACLETLNSQAKSFSEDMPVQPAQQPLPRMKGPADFENLVLQRAKKSGQPKFEMILVPDERMRREGPQEYLFIKLWTSAGGEPFYRKSDWRTMDHLLFWGDTRSEADKQTLVNLVTHQWEFAKSLTSYEERDWWAFRALIQRTANDEQDIFGLEPQYAGAVYTIRGDAKFINSDHDGAIADYRKAILINPQGAVAYKNRGDAKVRKKDFDSAIADYGRAIEIKPKYQEAYFCRSLAKYDNGDLDGATVDFDSTLETGGSASYHYYRRGEHKRRKGDLDGAITDFTKVIELDPKDAWAYRSRGEAKLDTNDRDGAIVDFTRAIEIVPQSAGAYLSRGIAKRLRSDLDGAIADYNKALEIDPQNGAAHYNRGLANDCKRDFDSAIVDYTKAIEINPEDWAAYINRGVAKREKGNLEGAIADYTKAIEIAPHKGDAFYNRGNAKLCNLDFDGAIADFTKTIEINPQDADAHNLRGKAKQAKGDVAGAIVDFTRAIELSPQDGKAYNNRGNAKRAKGDLDGAIADSTSAIDIDSQDAAAYNLRGNVRLDQGDRDGAIADFTKAVEINPEYGEAYINRGVAKREKGNLEGAIADYTKAIEIAPHKGDAFYNRGNAKLCNLDFDGAIADFTKTIEINPQDADAHNLRGKAKQAKGDVAGAQADFKMANEVA